MAEAEIISHTETVVRYVLGTSPDDIISPTPHISRGSAERRLGLMQDEKYPPPWLGDVKIFKVTSTHHYEEC